MGSGVGLYYGVTCKVMVQARSGVGLYYGVTITVRLRVRLPLWAQARSDLGSGLGLLSGYG